MKFLENSSGNAKNEKKKITENIKNIALLNTILNDYEYRTMVFFFHSVIINFVIAAFNIVTGIKYLSVWYGALALYYIALALQRGVLLVIVHNMKKKYVADSPKYQRATIIIYIANGIVLLLLEAALTAAIVQMVTSEKPVKTGMVIAIANAAYAFYKIISAAIKMAKANNFVLQTIRNIGWADAAVSMLALTVTLTDTFGDWERMRVMRMSVAIGVSIIIIGVGTGMIISGLMKLKKLSLCATDR
ncbi:MAG: hypothetical protein NC489_46615 [Ruminococcus flavefaciens]|nr:hypothetical protein [Ruminococcus flavefaciens]